MTTERARAERPTAADRCRYCDDHIDPRNFARDSAGFVCLPCADERDATIQHDHTTEC